MVARDKHAFWQALVFTLFIFIIGFILGFALEDYRAESFEENIVNSELNLLDEQLRSRIVHDFDIDCNIALDGLFSFADKIFWEASKLEDYDEVSTFSDELTLLHKRYDLLRMLLWAEGKELRERCSEDFHTVVYFFEYESDDLATRGEQDFYSRLLGEVKDRNPEEILLIPIAGNLDLDSVDLVLAEYEVRSLPAIVIDEEHVIDEVVTLEELENIIFQGNN